MEEKDLVTILKQEESDASSYHDSELAKAQEEGLNRYFGRPYGDEIKGRSQVVSHDVEDTINWIMPDLMRTFTSSEDLVSIKAMAPEDDGQFEGAPEGKSKADVMAAYLAHIYFEDNRGAENTHDFLFDGLLQRIGVQKVSWEDPEPGPPMMIEGVGEAQLMRYLEDSEYEILGFDDEEGPNGLQFVLEVRRTPKMGRVHIESVPPEEFAVHKAARTLGDAKYHRRKRLAYVSELARRYPDKKEDLLARRTGAEDMSYDGRYSARYPDDNVTGGSDFASSEKRRECYLIEEYIRIDFDDDGIVELRQIKRVDDVILENVAVANSDFVCWTPSRISHRVVGRSVYDMLQDITKIRTVITRSYLDGLSQTLSPRTYYDKNRVKQNGIDALIDNETGGLVECEGEPRAAIFESVPPDITAPALNGLAYFDERGAEASGVTKQAQGMDPAAMNKTATGIDLLQAAAKTRIEMFARWAGVALEDVFKQILRLVAAHQDGPRMVKLFGKWVEIDPRTWSDEMAVKVDIGSAGVSKQQRIANLMMVAAKQEQILATAGPTPMVGMQHLRNTYTSLVSDMGFPDPSIYFGEIPSDWQPPAPGPDPRIAEMEAKMQLENAKAQHGAQLAEAKQQQDLQATAQKIASERELALIKAQSEREIAQIRIAAETQLARERMVQERELAREKMVMEAQLADRDSERRSKAMVASSAMKSNGSDPSLGGNRPGGSLAQ